MSDEGDTQRKHDGEKARTFVRGTVEALYKDIERDQIAGVEQTIIDYQATPIPVKQEHPSLERAS